jgi:hypothetical protein
MGALTDKHIKPRARMLQVVLLEKEFIPSPPFLQPSGDCLYRLRTRMTISWPAES